MFKRIQCAQLVRYSSNQLPALLEFPPINHFHTTRYNWLWGLNQETKQESGIDQLLKEQSEEFSGKPHVEGISLGLAERTEEDCLRAKQSYTAPLQITISVGKKLEKVTLSYNMPILDSLGAFIINGRHRAFLNTLRRSEQVEKDEDNLKYKKATVLGQALYEQFASLIKELNKILNRSYGTDKDTLVKACRRALSNRFNPFFYKNDLLPLMDETNPLAIASHFNTLTLKGKGGVSERAKEGIRDVHNSQYGRICPIETPEGKPSGLNVHLSIYAQIDAKGDILTPFRKYNSSSYGPSLRAKPVYFTPVLEENKHIAQLTKDVVTKKCFIEEPYRARFKGRIRSVKLSEIDYTDYAPDQILSSASALIPFIEHDDGHRALMAAGMQKQALPLLHPEAPIVGTGHECDIARSFPAGTPAITKEGELALGKNLVVAYMPWYGYNYEDAIVISQEVVDKDLLTSLHTHEYDYELTGSFEASSFLPEHLAKLDANGIICVGTEVTTGDLLVARTEERPATDSVSARLFGLATVNSSLYADEERQGIVKSVTLVTRKGDITDNPAKAKRVIITLEEKRKIRIGDKLAGRHGNKGVIAKIEPIEKMPYYKTANGTKKHVQIILNPLGIPSRMNLGQLYEAHLAWASQAIAEQKASLYRNDPAELEAIFGEDNLEVSNLGDIGKAIPLAIPGFTGISRADIQKLFTLAKLDTSLKTELYYLNDNKKEEKFTQPVTVGITYMLKLHHMVEDKLHARSTGKYAQITKQPLQGKANNGGQRLGEMELWALEGYGAIQNVQDCLTLKADDLTGRKALEKAILDGKQEPEPTLPETVKVLFKTLNALCFDLEAKDKEGNPVSLFTSTPDGKALNPDDLKSITIKLASPETIRSWAKGRVDTPNWQRTGTDKNANLVAGGIFGKENTPERRENMGYIHLETPVIHTLFLAAIGSALRSSLLIEKEEGEKYSPQLKKELESLIYYKGYALLKENPEAANRLKIVTNEEYFSQDYSDYQALGTGALAVKALMQQLLPEEELRKLENAVLEDLPVLPAGLRPISPLKDGQIIIDPLNDFYQNILIINRRLLAMEAKSSKAEQEHTPYFTSSIFTNLERAKLQEQVDMLLKSASASVRNEDDNDKSLLDRLKSKAGLFRKNLLGKRQDYSGRSVILTDPKLKFNECSLPLEMALELFRPFVAAKLLQEATDSENSAKPALAKLQANASIDALLNKLGSGGQLSEEEEKILVHLKAVTENKVVLLNRQPSLHRLSIQAFYPLLNAREDMAIHLHPLVCAGFNADFDGDTMAVHLPISQAAQAEAKEMLAEKNLLSPKDGSPIATPTQGMVLGIYYATSIRDDKKPNLVAAPNEAPTRQTYGNYQKALADKALDLNTRIKVKLTKDYYPGLNEAPDTMTVYTSKGNLQFCELLPPKYRHKLLQGPTGKTQYWHLDKALAKGDIEELIDGIYNPEEPAETAAILDKIKTFGFQAATKAGISLAIEDFPQLSSEERDILKDIFASLASELEEYEKDFEDDKAERNKRIQEDSERTAQYLQASIGQKTQTLFESPVRLISESKARGNKSQWAQLTGIRSIISDTKGNIIPVPILTNFIDGMTSLDFFISCHGTRKGLIDTALGTEKSGYLARRLILAIQDLLITEEDCAQGKEKIPGLVVQAIKNTDMNPLTELVLKSSKKAEVLEQDGGFEEAPEEEEAGDTAEVSSQIIKDEEEIVIEPLEERLAGRYLAEAVGKLPANTLITKELAHELAAQASAVKIRTALTCGCKNGVCQKCYGQDLATRRLVRKGTPIGILAAQSLCEPATQFTLRTFHSGGVASAGDIQDGIGALNSFFASGRTHIKNQDSNILVPALIAELLNIYANYEVTINSKHIEVVLRKTLTQNEQGKITALLGINECVKNKGFLTAASFQYTASRLVEAALQQQQDQLTDINSQVILGQKIKLQA